MTSLRVEDVGNNWLPAKVSLEVAAGECVVISGPSGVGKSLLLRAIADLDEHQGKVSLDDTMYTDMPATEWRKQVGLLTADSAWWAEHVAEHMSKIPVAQLVALGFTKDVMKWSVDRLSTGEKQRLAILRVLANQPSILLLDEPTANLDPNSVEKVETLLLDYCRNKPAGLIWVSHDTAQAERIADRRYHFDENGLSEVKA